MYITVLVVITISAYQLHAVFQFSECGGNLLKKVQSFKLVAWSKLKEGALEMLQVRNKNHHLCFIG